jgi:hypothetical protein
VVEILLAEAVRSAIFLFCPLWRQTQHSQRTLECRSRGLVVFGRVASLFGASTRSSLSSGEQSTYRSLHDRFDESRDCVICVT